LLFRSESVIVSFVRLIINGVKMLRFCCLFVLSSLCVFAQDKNSIIAQHDNPNQIKIYGGIAAPVGEFTNKGTDLALGGVGAAVTGFTFGAGYLYYLNSYLFAVGSISYCSCPFDENVITHGATLTNGFHLSSTNNMIIPVLAGAGTYIDLIDIIRLYGTVQAGVTISKLSEINMTYDPQHDFITGSSTVTAFAFGLSGGVTIFKWIDINAKYINAAPEYNWSATITNTNTKKIRLQTNYFAVTLGIMF
jgi:hypothetical protein